MRKAGIIILEFIYSLFYIYFRNHSFCVVETMEILKNKVNLGTDKESEAIPLNIEDNSTYFYNKSQENIDSDLSRIKTSIDIVKQLRSKYRIGIGKYLK